SNGIAERVDSQPTANRGIVAFAANLPSGDACNPSGTARTFAVSFATGQTALTNEDGSLPALSVSSTRVIRDLAFQRVSGKLRLYTGDDSGGVVKLPAALGGGGSLKQLTWREVRATD